MENNFLLTEDMLWDYVDDLLNEEDRRMVESYLSQHADQRARVDHIRQEKMALSALPFEKPDRLFADRVLAAWAGEQVQTFAATAPPARRDWVVHAIAASLGVFLLAPLMVLVVVAFQAAPAVPVQLPTVKYPSVDEFSALMSNQALQFGLIAVPVILSLFLLDKYLHQRRVIDQLRRSTVA